VRRLNDGGREVRVAALAVEDAVADGELLKLGQDAIGAVRADPEQLRLEPGAVNEHQRIPGAADVLDQLRADAGRTPARETTRRRAAADPLCQPRGARPRPSSASAVLAVRLASAIDRATASTASISAGVSSAATAAVTSGGGEVIKWASASAVA
jgi:hypothetical protein